MGRRLLNRLIVVAVVATVVASSCATTPQPDSAQIADACKLLTDNKAWYKSLRASAKEWGAPMGYQLAVIRQESTFDRKAKAPRGERKWFGLVQGDRLSSAEGYSQALDATWEMYKDKTGNSGADRRNFKDSVDFIGWYFNTTGQRTGVGQYDYKAHYLAYHEGQSGYLQGSWKNKQWLIQTADRVASAAARYEGQISDCGGLKPKFLGIF
jgi:hypothetical protein